MYMNILVVLLVLGIAYAWLVRGFFSAFIHACCTLVAGAIAFGLWEPLSAAILGAAPSKGFLSFLEGSAGAISLIGTFAISLVVLRVIADKLTPNNVTQLGGVDYAGGGLMGLFSGLVSAGILVIGLGSARLPSSFLGYQPVWFSEDRATAGGSLVENDSLWIPADAITAGLYSAMSTTTLATSDPLAKWHPDVRYTGFASRINYRAGSGKNVIRPGDVRITSTYVVGDPERGTPASELLNDAFATTGVQRYVNADGEPVNQGAIRGYILRFLAGAKESTGQVILGNGQLRLLVETPQGGTDIIFPVALISQASASEQTVYGRWRFDGPETFISSVGGASEAIFGVEFVTPPGVTPIALYVKNLRIELDTVEEDPATYASAAARDNAIIRGQLIEGISVGDLDTSRALVIDPSAATSRRGGDISTAARFEGTLQTSDVSGFQLDENNRLVSGQGVFNPSQFSRAGSLPRNLRVETYAATADTAVVQFDVSPGRAGSMLSPVVSTLSMEQAPVLVDTAGTPYRPVGYYYKDNDKVEIRFLPGSPIGSLSDLPAISSSRSDQQLILLFQVSRGVQLQHYAIGQTAIVTFEPTLRVEGR